MKFVVTGTIAKGESRNFKIEVDAKSEKHARELALVKIGGVQSVRKSSIRITEVKKK
ncbi:MAG: hypothetical protein KGH98_02575 [Candidatus Micrarchaeota archaeon]|nr:hypothetical protein [Candidatus Micrarchaeota archaeon]